MATLARHPLGRVLISLVSGIFLLLTASLMVLCSNPYSRLGAEQLHDSRGSLQNFHVDTFPCDPLTTKGLLACTGAGANCKTCRKGTYDDVGTVKGGGNNSGTAGAGDCGTIFFGICDTAKKCVPSDGGDTKQACTKPVGLPTQQPTNP